MKIITLASITLSLFAHNFAQANCQLETPIPLESNELRIDSNLGAEHFVHLTNLKLDQRIKDGEVADKYKDSPLALEFFSPYVGAFNVNVLGFRVYVEQFPTMTQSFGFANFYNGGRIRAFYEGDSKDLTYGSEDLHDPRYYNGAMRNSVTVAIKDKKLVSVSLKYQIMNCQLQDNGTKVCEMTPDYQELCVLSARLKPKSELKNLHFELVHDNPQADENP